MADCETVAEIRGAEQGRAARSYNAQKAMVADLRQQPRQSRRKVVALELWRTAAK